MSEFVGLELEPRIEAWAAVDRIMHGRVSADDKETLLGYIEQPLRQAVGTFFDKHITTFGSSCNANDYFGWVDARGFSSPPMAWISLDYSSLSEHNRTVLQQYPYHEIKKVDAVDGETYNVAGVYFPIAPTDFPEDIGQQALAFAEQFEAQ